MGVIERKERERESRRKLILDSARDLILEHGVEAVSMVDIAHECELSKATLYLYFRNKESLLEAIYEEAGHSFVEYIESRMSENDSGISAIKVLWQGYLDRFSDSNDIFILIGIKNYIAPSFPLIQESPSRTARNPGVRLVTLIRDVIARGIKDGTLEADLDADTVARTVLIVSSGIIDTVARLPRDLRDMSIVVSEMKRVFEIFLRGISGAKVDRSQLILSTSKK
ncbi:MAG: helix-turn-helix transcriptional regulator [Spirochaetales bacterium]|nr:helix-turn-helix transcriptional regulator [Spirochaetales bacterium]